jgi:hypothetical protein
VFHQVVQALIDALLAIPPVRFVMGLVDGRWRPLWAALWLAVIAYVVARTMNQLAARRLRLQLLRESIADPLGRKPGQSKAIAANASVTDPVDTDVSGGAIMSEAPTSVADVSGAESPGREPVLLEPRPAVPGAPVTARAGVPVPVLLGALAVGALAVAGVAFATRSAPNAPAPTAASGAAVPDSGAPSEAPMDVGWRSGRMDDDDCIGTFEISNGTGTRTRFTAFAMDTSGAVMARDSARVDAAVSGLFVEFRFRHVDCDEIDDWRLEARTATRR